jgi:predicted metal-dependent TIM-barrel fold hydrolase
MVSVDTQDMVAVIRAVGPEHFMLSSDAGIPLLPQTVEAYRLLAAMLRAYGMTEVEMRQLMTGSAKELLPLS